MNQNYANVISEFQVNALQIHIDIKQRFTSRKLTKSIVANKIVVKLGYKQKINKG